MASINVEDLDPINNNTMSNNNNSSNVNNNNTAVLTSVVIPGSCNDASAPCNGGNADANAAVIATAVAVPVVSSVDINSSSSNSRSRSSGSRRSRSGGRSRSRRRHSQSSGRRSRHHSRGSHKRRERNFPSALCNMISIVILCTALAEPNWIRIDNGYCSKLTSTGNGERPYRLDSLRNLGALQFFYFGEMITNDPNVGVDYVVTEYSSGPEDSDRLVNCVTERVVIVFKIIIALTFLAILTSLFSFSLDLVGLDQRLFRILRQSAIFNIFTVVVCVGITTLLYWATVDILDLQLNPKIPINDNVRVLFDVSFYLITAAGACSVISVACNCLQRKISDMAADGTPAARSILDDQFSDGTENLLAIASSSSFHHGHDFSSPMTNLPPPPPYTP